MNVVIIEDEAAAVRRLKKMLAEIAPDVVVVEELDGIGSSVEWFRKRLPVDLIFLDIHLSDGSSFEIFNRIEINEPVVFTTAYDQYAIEAFRVNAVDYLLKPIKEKELRKALQKHRKLKNDHNLDIRALSEAIRRNQSPSRRFLIRLGQQIKIVELKDVAYFYTQNKITFLVSRDGKRFPLDHSLEKLEELVDPRCFFRINRQFIIHVEAIGEMYTHSKSRVKIDLVPPCEVETIVSTERSPQFKKWLLGEK